VLLVDDALVGREEAAAGAFVLRYAVPVGRCVKAIMKRQIAVMLTAAVAVVSGHGERSRGQRSIQARGEARIPVS